jgi:Flp pilus assembly pilin Flp
MQSMTHPQRTDKQPGVLSGWWADESGVTAIEYGLLAALVVLGALAGFIALSAAVEDAFVYWSTKILEAL